MSLFKPTPPAVDPQILAMASLTELPTQPVNLRPRGTFLGNELQRVKTVIQPPVINTAAPVNISRRVLPNGNRQFRVQFVKPVDPNHQATSVSVRSPSGTQQFFASSADGPIIFTTPKTAGSAQLVVQNQSDSGAVSDTGLGVGLSRTINQS